MRDVREEGGSLTVPPVASNWTAALNFYHPLAGLVACGLFNAADYSRFTIQVQISLDFHARTRSYGKGT